MNLKAEIKLKGMNEFYDIIKNEMMEKERSSLSIKKNKNEIVLMISAKDITSFRTSLFSVQKYLDVYNKMRRIK